MTDRITGKVLGCLLGGLIGDAMGAPAEGRTYAKIEEEFGEVTDFEGSGTDDTAIKHILCQAIFECSGRLTCDGFASAFLKNKDKYDLFYVPVRNMFHKIEDRVCRPVDAGYGNMHSSSSAMCISPIGLVNPCDPERAAAEAYEVAGLIHAGTSGFCRDAASAMAAAVAEAMRLDASVSSVLDAATACLHPVSAAEMAACITECLEDARAAGGYEVFRAQFYERRLRTIICDPRETVPCSLALFLLARGDPPTAIRQGANFGRDADTIASMAGALAGALEGASAFPEAWIAKADDQSELADKLVAVIRARIARRERILTELARLLPG